MEGLEENVELADFLKKLKISKYGKSKISLDRMGYNKTLNESKVSESKYDAGASTMSKATTTVDAKNIFSYNYYFYSYFSLILILLSLYDIINNDDSSSISWEEFISFFAINMDVSRYI